MAEDEVAALASLCVQRPVIVLAASGSAADEIAGARTGQPADDPAQALDITPWRAASRRTAAPIPCVV